MFKLFICFILFCASQTNFAYTNVRDDAPWFRAGGSSLRKKWATGVINGIVDTNCEDETSGKYTHGECLSAAECVKEKGKKGGICSLTGVCCLIEKTCSETTNSKISYFVSPSRLENECSLKVKIYSQDVCQIRLDFEKFDIHQPTQKGTSDAFMCNEDKFKVGKVGSPLGFSSLCGYNDGQHIYIPIEEQNEIDLRFLLKNRTSNNMRPQNPEWRIKIRQIECYNKRNQGVGQGLDAHSKLVALYQSLKQKKKNYTPDYDLQAPSKCLQYYPEQSGTFESFNYNNGQGCYIGGLDYSICFKTESGFCSVNYSPVDFQMNKNDLGQIETKEEKCHSAKEAGECLSQDYIRINEGKSNDNERQDYYCGENFIYATSKSHEPLYVKVHTDKYRAYNTTDCNGDPDEHAEKGFRINYDLGDCQEID